MSEIKYLDLAGLTAYDAKIKAWHQKHLGVISDDAIRELFETSAYRMVDLGLPSGLKWADRNVGAETPQDAGLYFSWGNVDGHAVDENGNVTDGYSFDYNTYSTTLGSQYTGSTLDAEHDAATSNMGGDWRIPTSAEILELVENTDHYYISEDGNIVAGPFDYETSSSDKGLDYTKKLRSICFVKKDATFNYNDRSNFIEIPFAGNCYGPLLDSDGLDGYIWSSSVNESNDGYAYGMYFHSGGFINADFYRSCHYGLSVRAVKK